MRLLLIFGLLFTNSLYSQSNFYSSSNEKLESKNGFKDFHFGDLKSKYLNQIEPSFVGSKYYIFNGTEPSSLFDEIWNELGFFFYDGKLGIIQVYWEDDDYVYQKILKNLELVFGSSNSLANDDLINHDLIEYNLWESNNIVMTLRRYKRDSSYSDVLSCSTCRITLIIENIGMKKSSLEKDF